MDVSHECISVSMVINTLYVLFIFSCPLHGPILIGCCASCLSVGIHLVSVKSEADLWEYDNWCLLKLLNSASSLPRC